LRSLVVFTVGIPHGFQKPNRAFSTFHYVYNFLVQKAPRMQQQTPSSAFKIWENR